MSKLERKKDWLSIIVGILLIICAIPMLCCYNWAGIDLIIVIVAGIGFIISGIKHFVVYSKVKKIKDGAGVLIFQGVIDCILGLIFLCEPLAGGVAMNFFLGFAILYYGVAMLCMVFSKQFREMTPWGAVLIISIIMILLGFGIIFNLWGLAIIPVIVAITFIVVGVRNIIDGWHGYVTLQA